MAEKALQIDSGILQFAPKGGYYEGFAEQYAAINEMWTDLFNYDRTLFCLITLLSGTGYSKGSMSHMLLSNPQPSTQGALVPEGLAFDYENKVIKYNLHKERTPRALKNLLMLSGREGKSRVNNSRTRRIILDYIFNRDNESLDILAINFKSKLKALIRHALGKQDLYKILTGNVKLFNKWIGCYNENAGPVLYYLFDKEFISTDKGIVYYKRIDQVMKLKEAAINQDVDLFRRYMKGLPILTVMGYRNTYKVAIDKAELFEKTKVSSRQAVQMQTSSERSGHKVDVNYKKQDLYDLWKLLYSRVLVADIDELQKIREGINYQINNTNKIDIGEVFVIIDASKSMMGSDTRPLHPFLTTLSILSTLDNIKDVFYVGGSMSELKDGFTIVEPSGSTNLWRGLTEGVLSGTKNILVISDGYENSIKGMFDHVYKHFKSSGYEFNLTHINPVMAADAKTGTTRCLTEDVTPLPVSSYKFLETQLIFERMIEHREVVKKLLVGKYTKLIGG